ncbi:phosphotransferase [Paenibacillus sp. alder61]|uniref:Phosphotransferase n=1 Tax=Paenibacillus faecis TaxID=862114 RepID=A0A5D0CQB0_9BACL|nr:MULTISPECIES: phosphotransferase [Paenibacillus]MCA1294787.1 phosphotransferase [Paenibacillus sp. alder61]TYA11355.1 phosphotransferase [Paenibacillus faecis]
MSSTVIRDPNDADQFSLDRLRSCLLQAGFSGAGNLESYDVEQMDATNASMYKIRLRPDAPDVRLPRSLILKVCRSQEFGPSEVYYYGRDYRDADDIPLLACYDAAFEDHAYHLLLEDVSDSHRNSWELSPDSEYAAQVAAAVAKLHSCRWGPDRIKEAGYPEMDTSQLDRYLAHVERGCAPLLEELMQEGRHDLAAVARLVFDKLPAVLRRRIRQFPSLCTLVHGDINPGNILVPKSGSGGSVFLIDRQPFDWSLLSWFGPADLAYLTVLFWEPENRRKLERDLLKAYHQVLSGRCAADYRWEQLWIDYKLSAMQCFYVAASWCIDPAERTEMRWLWRRELERAVLAFQDLQGGELLNAAE